MALFPVNQNTQFFTPTEEEVAMSQRGTSTPDGNANIAGVIYATPNKVWFSYTSGSNVHCSEIINIDNGGYIRYVKAEGRIPNIVKILSNYEISDLAVGDTISINIHIKDYKSLGLFKEYVSADVVYKEGMSKGILATTLACNLWKNMNELNIFDIYVYDTKITKDNVDTLPSDSGARKSDFFIVEKTNVDNWIRGMNGSTEIQLDTSMISISRNGTPDQTFFINKNKESYFERLSAQLKKIPNSRDIADLEYFCLGEHGDTQRMVGYPYIHPVYLKEQGYYRIHADDEKGYDLILIHHNTRGTNHAVQKSEHDIIIALPTVKKSSNEELFNSLTKALKLNVTLDNSKQYYHF